MLKYCLTVLIVLSSHILSAAERPNIVLIMADDFGYECLSCDGSLDYETPYLDKLAAEGARFEHFHAQPICTPTRVKLMTGLSNKRNYIRFGRLARDQKTFGHIFKNAGYKTCVAGKWQLGNEPDAPQHFGFEESLLWQHTRGRADDGFDSRYPNPRLELNGQEVDYNDGEFSSDLFSDYINNFIALNRDKPFFAYYPMALTHCPFCPTPDSDDWDPKSRGSKSYKGDPQYFADMVSYVDKTVAKIDANLKRLGIRQNTLLIFIGDNGTDKPIVTNTTFGKVAGNKGSMKDGGNRVPCIVSWPGNIESGQVIETIADLSDILPTICDAADIDLPQDIPFDGYSFLPLLKGNSTPHREAIYMWYARNGGPNAEVFARNAEYKLYANGEFYHVAADRLEQKNLAEKNLSPDVEAVRQMLQAKLDHYAKIEYLSETSAKGPTAKKKKKAAKSQ
ncbi:MAG: sulfatase-like hydrolase/transferase [Planctomycetaceae bacterium]|nr:sulfatase-like hydrolase/transferase [Planctomycetaceae bacterium]